VGAEKKNAENLAIEEGEIRLGHQILTKKQAVDRIAFALTIAETSGQIRGIVEHLKQHAGRKPKWD